MGYEYVLWTSGGDRAFVYDDGPPLIDGQVITLPTGERFTVTKIVEQPGVGKAGVAEAKPDPS
jgi:hypothetical protein